MSEFHRHEHTIEQGAQEARNLGDGGGRSGPAAAAGMWEPTQRQWFDPRRKAPFLAALLSVVPGVGQIYIGYYMRGIATAASFLIAVILGAWTRGALSPVFVMSAIFIWIFNLIDAGRMAALYNHAAAGSNVVDVPQDLKLPELGGSILGGIALLLFGTIALSTTAFGYSLEWLERWWPAFPLTLGVYLFARGLMDVANSRNRQAKDENADHAS
jgi:hypothetical protein